MLVLSVDFKGYIFLDYGNTDDAEVAYRTCEQADGHDICLEIL
jgi:hypothetical protein